MSHKAVRVGITSVVLALAFSGLLWSTLSEGTEYYKHVDEVTVDPALWEGKKLQVHGFIVDKSIMRRPDSLDYRFEIENNGEVIRAEYSGLVPDTFQDGAEVVVKGQLGPDGFVVAPNGVMAKCPSKYEPKAGAASTAATYSSGQ
jgi:cytochrome c-type biogenesis protein CcmE